MQYGERRMEINFIGRFRAGEVQLHVVGVGGSGQIVPKDKGLGAWPEVASQANLIGSAGNGSTV